MSALQRWQAVRCREIKCDDVCGTQALAGIVESSERDGPVWKEPRTAAEATLSDIRLRVLVLRVVGVLAPAKAPHVHLSEETHCEVLSAALKQVMQ